MTQYRIPIDSVNVEQEIKKSRFITQLAYTDGRAQAMQFISDVKNQYPGARHYCWAYICAAPDDPHSLGFSDDGEPSGTAGKPMLAQLKGSGVGKVTAVVTRYSGGIKLGTGGLVKAYGGGVSQALALLKTEPYIPLSRLQICYAYTHQTDVELAIRQFDGTILHAQYQEQVTLEIALPQANLTRFVHVLRDNSQGKIQFFTNN